MVGSGNAIESTSCITNLVEATRFLMEQHVNGIGACIYVDEPPITTGDMVHIIYDMFERSQPSLPIPLSVAAPIATVSDLLAEVTGIDLPITSARIAKFNRSIYFNAEAIRDEGFQQPVSMRETFRRTLEWHLDAVHDEALS